MGTARLAIGSRQLHSVIRTMSSSSSNGAEGPGMRLLLSLQDHERRGVPIGAGTDTKEGFDLGRMHALLSALGNPHKRWKAVHIAGTKGKGSTGAFLASALAASGYRTGCYSSPHVVSLTERIRVDDQCISIPELDALLASAGPAVEGLKDQGISHFELLTAAAFKHFAAVGVDVAIIEAGLGGARDATNVFDPDDLVAAVVTPVGRDHLEALGGSVYTVARAKAGIIKRGRPVVLAAQPEPEAASALLEYARSVDAPVVHAAKEVDLLQAGDSGKERPVHVVVKGKLLEEAFGVRSETDLPRLGLEGRHQLENAGLALAAAAVLKAYAGFDRLSLDTIAKGFHSTWLPGRFQRCMITGDSIDGPKSPLVILDGAHTPEAARYLVETVRATVSKDCPVAVILAAAADKDIGGICKELGTLQPVATFPTEVDISGARTRSAAPGTIMAAWQFNVPRPGRVIIQPSLRAALERARMELAAAPAASAGQQGGVILMTGSMHIAGAALKQLPLKSI